MRGAAPKGCRRHSCFANRWLPCCPAPALSTAVRPRPCSAHTACSTCRLPLPRATPSPPPPPRRPAGPRRRPGLPSGSASCPASAPAQRTSPTCTHTCWPTCCAGPSSSMATARWAARAFACNAALGGCPWSWLRGLYLLPRRACRGVLAWAEAARRAPRAQASEAALAGIYLPSLWPRPQEQCCRQPLVSRTCCQGSQLLGAGTALCWPRRTKSCLQQLPVLLPAGAHPAAAPPARSPSRPPVHPVWVEPLQPAGNRAGRGPRLAAAAAVVHA